MAKKRIIEFDLIKLFAIYLVIWGHCTQYFFSSPVLDEPIYRFIYSFHMPLFIMVSGFFAISSLNKSVSVFMKQKILHLLLPCVSWGILSFIIEWLIIDNTQNSLLENLLISIISKFWFLKCLFMCYMIYYFIKKIIRNRLCFMILTLIVSQLLPYYHINDLYPFFLIGTLLSEHNKSFFKYKNIIGVISLMTFIILTLSMQILNLKYVYWNHNIITFFTALTACFCIFILFNNLSKRSPIYERISKYGQYTLDVYIFQSFILEEFLANLINLDSYNFYISNYILNPIFSILILVICLYLSVYVNQLKLLRVIFMGKEK